MKKLVILSTVLLLAFSCKKPNEEAKPEETACLIQKISYDDGNYEVYKFDANKRLESIIITYSDNGKIVEVPFRYEYNAAGNLLKTIGNDGWTDNYIYDANGLLTRVDFKDDKGGLNEQFTVTMDTKKRVTKIVTKVDGLTGTYEYNGPNGVFSKSEVIRDGKIDDQYIIKSYETDQSKKGFDLAIKGHAFDPSYFTNQIIYSVPFNLKPNGELVNTGIVSTQWNSDYTQLTDKLRVAYEFTTTRKYNSNNFATERISNYSDGDLFKKTYSYSNCN